MLKSNNTTLKTKLEVLNSIQLSDDKELEAKGKGQHFISRFIEPGIAEYKDTFGKVLITKETLDKFIRTIIGVPIIIKHKDITSENVNKERVGVVSEVWYNPEDGWYYCSGILFDSQAIDLVKNQGWSVSCTYDFETDNKKGTYHGLDYDMQFTNGEFLHLALVDNPRYERANIVMNSKDEEQTIEEKPEVENSLTSIFAEAIAEVVINCLGESKNSFPKHKGRPGKIGGSLPKEDSKGEKQETKEDNKVSQEDEPNYIAEKYKNYKEFETTYKNYIDTEPENYKYNTVEETLEDLGIKENQPLVIKTPLGKENITVDSIDHIVKGGGTNHPPDKTRFKSINKMIETLKKPLLIIEKSNNHRYYFKIFKSKDNKSKNDMVVISPKDEVYTNFPIDRGTWFFKQIKTGKIKYDVLNH